MKHICYKSGYKYQLDSDYIVAIPLPYSDHNIDTEYVSLSGTGVLSIRKGYAWDGPSGPTLDTRNALRGSLVHDALYQLIRLGHLPQRYRDRADDIFYSILIEDGMTRIRAALWRKTLGLFGGKNARPSGEKPVMMAP